MSLEHSTARQRTPVFEPSYTVDEFCAAERMSRSMIYKAWQEGWGAALLSQWREQAHHPRSAPRMAAPTGAGRTRSGHARGRRGGTKNGHGP
jgi:hypothetical protein